MDPNSCLMGILDNLAEGDRESAMEGIENLETWLANGGFEPNWRGAISYMFASVRELSEGDE